MAVFSEGFREQVRAASDIVEVIGGYIPLKRAGANFVALCPFHKEKSPSFNVNPHRQIFHCFGCQKGGDVFTFVKEYENIGFGEAVRRLAERARIPIEEASPGATQRTHLKETLLLIHEQITQRWQASLRNDAGGQIARDYLAKRGVSSEAIDLFRLGYAPDTWEDTVNWAKSKSFELALVEQSGLIIKREGGEGHYDRFRGRLIFPICDEQGRVIGFSGRVLSGDEKTAKYVNSPETPLFTKGRVMFGLDKSKRALLDARCAVVCEGQLDMMACYMGGVKNVIAPQGTALTSDHARILKRYVDEVVLCFDADNAGQNAAVRSFESLLANGFSVRVASLPSPHDPDSFIKAFGGEEFQKRIDQAAGFFDYLLGRLCLLNDIATDRGRNAVVRGMAENLAKTDNKVLTDTYAQKTALRLGVSAEAVRAEFKKIKRPAPAREFATDSEPIMETEEMPEEFVRPSPQEFWLLKLMLNQDDWVDWIAAMLDMRWVRNAAARQIIERRLELQREEAWRGLAAFLDAFDEEDPIRGLITEIVAENRAIPNAEQTLKGTPTKKGVLELLRAEYLENELRQVQLRLHEPGLSEEQQHECIARQTALRQEKARRLTTAG
jgi:DNA primase